MVTYRRNENSNHHHRPRVQNPEYLGGCASSEKSHSSTSSFGAKQTKNNAAGAGGINANRLLPSRYACHPSFWPCSILRIVLHALFPFTLIHPHAFILLSYLTPSHPPPLRFNQNLNPVITFFCWPSSSRRLPPYTNHSRRFNSNLSRQSFFFFLFSAIISLAWLVACLVGPLS